MRTAGRFTAPSLEISAQALGRDVACVAPFAALGEEAGVEQPSGVVARGRRRLRLRRCRTRGRRGEDALLGCDDEAVRPARPAGRRRSPRAAAPGLRLPGSRRLVGRRPVPTGACHELAHALVRHDHRDDDPPFGYAEEELVAESGCAPGGVVRGPGLQRVRGALSGVLGGGRRGARVRVHRRARRSPRSAPRAGTRRRRRTPTLPCCPRGRPAQSATP